MSQPFELFRVFSDRLKIGLFTKQDAVQDDAALRERLECTESASLNQVHGKVTYVVRDFQERQQQGDGLVTDVPGLLLSVRSADCQTFMVYAPEKHVVGLIHAGWKSLVVGMIPAFFDLLQKNYDISGEDTYVGAGPSLCLKCSAFTDPQTELPSIDPRFFHGKQVDLRAIAEDQLRQAGVRPERFERHADCTCCHPEIYRTYRGGDKEAVKKSMTNYLACALKPVV